MNQLLGTRWRKFAKRFLRSCSRPADRSVTSLYQQDRACILLELCCTQHTSHLGLGPGDGALLAGPSSWAGGADFFVTIVSLSSIGEAKGESSALCAPFELRTDPISVLSLSFPRGELGDSEGGGVDPDFQRLRAFFISSVHSSNTSPTNGEAL